MSNIRSPVPAPGYCSNVSFADALDVSDAASPILAASNSPGHILADCFRVSFSGELAYELAVPARFGDAAIRAIMRRRRTRRGALRHRRLGVMRIEKGHIAGNE